VIPTIGRTELLRQCLVSLLGCVPPPAEIVVVDQSGAGAVTAMVGALGKADLVRVVTSDGRGIARATNDGVRAARHRTVLVTHDDCTVVPDWVGEAVRLLEAQPGGIVTGRVLAPANAAYVPSTIDGDQPVEYTGRITSGVLYPANMAFDREAMLDFGGFDERAGLRLAAEDNDLCYRWLRDGRPLRFEPSLVVWHHDWRSPEQLRRTHVTYARGQGAFYAKHLLLGDRQILALLRWDLSEGLKSKLRGLLGGTPRWQDPYREMTGSLLRGMVAEMWRERSRFL
jgi:GT2 family glycosyltransferase